MSKLTKSKEEAHTMAHTISVLIKRRRMIKTFKLFWISGDSQGSFDMGTFATKGEAEAAIDAAKAELIGQCGEDYQKAEIEAGSWSIIDESSA